MTFKLFRGAKYNELAPELVQTKELNFDTADVWVDVSDKKVILDTNNGIVNVDFNEYDDLLYAIVRVGRDLVFRDALDAMTRAINDLTYYMRHPYLQMSEDLVDDLLNKIEKTKERLSKIDYKLMIRIGQLSLKDVDNLINSSPEVDKAVKGAIEQYRELCWKTYEDDDPDYCDKVSPIIDAIVYVIPEEKSIVIVVDVDEIGEVYRVMNKYDNAYDFLKAVDEYYNKVIDF